jgi:redox-sensing transcriptional repressor
MRPVCVGVTKKCKKNGNFGQSATSASPSVQRDLRFPANTLATGSQPWLISYGSRHGWPGVSAPIQLMKPQSASNQRTRQARATPPPAVESAVTPAGTPSAEAVQAAGVACVKRLPAYLQMLRVLQGEGHEYVSGTVLATTHSLEPVIVRKDLAVTGVVGTPRRGFRISDLIAAIERFLGWNNQTKAVLVGVGNLGTALLGYQGFENLGLRIAGAFDRDPAKIGKWIQGRKVQPISQLAAFVRRGGIRLGVLTVPAAVAQETADLMIQAGIRGVWNFSPVRLEVPAGAVAQKEDLAEGLAVLSHKLQHLPPTERARQALTVVSRPYKP